MTTLLIALSFGASALPAQQLADLKTTPERTSYEQTSTYADVISFIRAVDAASNLIHFTTIGKTFEGREMPLVVVGRVPSATPEAVRNSGKLRVYLQGNIHAGEVEGKEVLQMLLREFAQGQHRDWLDSMVFIINPIYNADGNEKFGVRNRGRQHGPVKGMGVRPNAQGFDLNRDHMKLESPEARALVSMFNRYDPHMSMDLHTTDGSEMAYYLTYSPPLHPNTAPSIISLLRERWLPTVTRNVKAKHGWDFYYYGNLSGRDSTRGWYTFEHVARFNNNYGGIRNRLAILSEAYSYATFEDRIKATHYFVDEVLDFAHKNTSELRRTVEQADRTSIIGQSMGTRARIDPNGKPQTILLGKTVLELNPHSGDSIRRKTAEIIPTPMKEYGTFAPTETAVVPRAYFVPPGWMSKVAPLLELHGVRGRSLSRDTTVQAQRFRIDSTTVSARPFQNHRERQIFGAYESASVTMPAGTLVIEMNQPLARLVFLLLEPRSDDGLVDWNFLDPEIEKETYYPIVKTLR